MFNTEKFIERITEKVVLQGGEVLSVKASPSSDPGLGHHTHIKVVISYICDHVQLHYVNNRLARVLGDINYFNLKSLEIISID